MSKQKKTDINTCYICNSLRVVERHYSEWMCNACYKLALRIWNSDREMSRDDVLTRAISRRMEIPLLRDRSKHDIMPPIGRKNWEDNDG